MNCTELEVRTEGVRDANAPRRICFVCTGNTCRSPMAAAVANALGEGRIDAFSAGLWTADGEPISANAVTALEHAGVRPTEGRDYHKHTAHTVTETDAASADLLVAVSPSHAMELLMRFPAAAERIACMPKPISDPFGGDLARYETCLSEITEGVRALLGEETA